MRAGAKPANVGAVYCYPLLVAIVYIAKTWPKGAS